MSNLEQRLWKYDADLQKWEHCADLSSKKTIGFEFLSLTNQELVTTQVNQGERSVINIIDSDQLEFSAIDQSYDNRVSIIANIKDASIDNSKLSNEINNSLELATGAQQLSEKSQPNGYASLNENGIVPDNQLPSFSFIVEYNTIADFPNDGSEAILHIAKDTGNIYRWEFNSYIEISENTGIEEVVEDISPVLGGNLDVSDKQIISTSSRPVVIAPDNGLLIINAGGNQQGSIKLNCESNSHGVIISSPAHAAAADYILTLPENSPINGNVIQTDSSGQLSWFNANDAYATSYQGFLAETALQPGIIIDEDTMISNLDTHIPTQQSVKAYVDTSISDLAEVVSVSGGGGGGAILNPGFDAGWSYQALNNESFILYEKYIAGGIGWDYTDNDPNVTPSTGLSWRTVTLDLNAAYTAVGGTLPDNIVGISIDSNGTFSGSGWNLLHAQILPGDWTPTVDQTADNGIQHEAEIQNALWYRQHLTTGSGGVIPISPDGTGKYILKLNWGWRDNQYRQQTERIELQINVNGFWVEGASGGHIIEDEGTILPQRSTLNFIGPGVTASDDGFKTLIEINATGGGGLGEADTGFNAGWNYQPLQNPTEYGNGEGVSAFSNVWGSGGRARNVFTRYDINLNDIFPSGLPDKLVGIEAQAVATSNHAILHVRPVNSTSPTSIQQTGTDLVQSYLTAYKYDDQTLGDWQSNGIIPVDPAETNHFTCWVGSSDWRSTVGPGRVDLNIKGFWVESDSGGHVIQDEGTALSQRSNLDFIGDGVVAVDNENDNKTEIYIPGSPPGSIIAFAGQTSPDGWFVCDGSLKDRNTYSNLYSIIGTTFGVGDGSTTFNLPDLRGEFIRGWDNGAGVDSGRAFGSNQDDELKSHTHTGSTDTSGSHSHSGSTDDAGVHNHAYSDTFRTVDVNSGQSGDNETIQDGTQSANRATSYDGSHSHAVTIESGGSHSHAVTIDESGGTETRPRNVALNYIIKF